MGEIGLGQGIGRQCHRPGGSVVSEYGVVVGKIDQAVVETFIKAIDYADAAARLARQIQYDVGAHGRTEHDEAVLRGVRGDRLAVEGDDDRLVALDVEPEDADRQSVVLGKSVSVRVDLGGCRMIKKKHKIMQSDLEV